MFQRPNQVFELPTVPHSARLKWFDLLEESLCDTPFEPVRYVSYGPVRNTRIERFRVTGTNCISGQIYLKSNHTGSPTRFGNCGGFL